MNNKPLFVAAFVVGGLAIGWVGAGYVGSHPLALVMTVCIAAFYLMGALELHRFHQASTGLRSALGAIQEPLARLEDWLAAVPASLQGPVRLRVEGERSALPGPTMTPYLVGLLVLLGMLGTFGGMVVTLKGAVMALESTTDLATIRAALAAPVKGLGLAFGTSVAGVAASAMLGLMSALCRRERLQVAQALDNCMAGALRRFSLAHQREETLQSLQLQARAVPELMAQMQVLMGQMARQAEDLNDRLLASQDRFHSGAEAAYSALAASVDKTLQVSLTESARAAGATIQPVVAATMSGIARETAQFQQHLAHTVQAQLDGLAGRFDDTVTTVAATWTRALAQHELSNERLSQHLGQALTGFNDSFEQRGSALLATVEGNHAALQREFSTTATALARSHGELTDQLVHTVQAQLEGLSERLGAQATAASEQAAAQDQERLGAWSRSLEAVAATLQQEWQQAGAQALDQQQQICQTLEATARATHAQAEAQARSTIAEMSRLIDAAAEAPRAAADLVGELRQKLSDSMARDNDLLEERGRIMQTLAHLLDAVNQAATEQRGAIDALVSSSASVLDRVGTRFAEQIEAETGKLGHAAVQITGSAVEVASLGEAFGLAVQLFSDSSEALTTHLQRIEAALSKSTARSDDQLAYYVAQAREIIDLSISSQQQIVDDLRQLTSRRAPLAGEVA